MFQIISIHFYDLIVFYINKQWLIVGEHLIYSFGYFQIYFRFGVLALRNVLNGLA